MPKTDKFLNHEALHTVYVLTDVFHRSVVKHPLVKDRKNLRELAVKAEEALHDLYQAIGNA